jgi:putative ABC transport system ATP-binding protein
MENTLIDVRCVTKVYDRGGSKVTPLKCVSLSIPRGEFVALMGPSGSGKSTLLNLVSGIDTAAEGEVVVDGVSVAALGRSEAAAWRSRNIGYIFQAANLIPVLTAFENVEVPLFLHKLSRAKRRERVETVLRLVGLAERADHFPNQLSGGEEQRVAVARAIVADPTILLADEPTGELDAKAAAEVLDILSVLNERFDKTILLVTHDPSAAKRARVVYHLDKGELSPAPEGRAADVQFSPALG